MSDETIRADDLVYVARVDHPCSEKYLGAIRVVPEIAFCELTCAICGHNRAPEYCASFADGYGLPLAWLKKIEPLRDSEAADELVSAPVLPPEPIAA